MRSLLAVVASAALSMSCTQSATSSSGAQAPDPARGRYLVEQIGMCHDCHSPRDEKGEFVVDRWLAGSPLPFAATVPMPWAEVAPPIAGLPTLDDAQAVAFLTTGVLPAGRAVRPPMPAYRFSEADARAVVAYLRKPIAPPPGTR